MVLRQPRFSPAHPRLALKVNSSSTDACRLTIYELQDMVVLLTMISFIRGTAWSSQGIVGRGVLLDFASYASRHNITGYDAASRSEIGLDQVKAVAAESGITFQPGDILVLRTGQTRHLYNVNVFPLARTSSDTYSAPQGLLKLVKTRHLTSKKSFHTRVQGSTRAYPARWTWPSGYGITNLPPCVATAPALRHGVSKLPAS